MMIWNVPVIDPILSISISLFVLWNVVKNLKQVFAVFLQRVPHGFDAEQFIQSIQQIPGVVDVHHTHVWTLDGEHHVLTTHIVVRKTMPREEIASLKCQVRGLVCEDSFEHMTIDVELEGEACASG